MVGFRLQDYEVINLPGANIYFGPHDEHQAVGFLRLDPHGTLLKHARPVEEWLGQAGGGSDIIFLEDDKETKRVSLKRGTSLKIPPNQLHQHINPTDDESLTSWHFDGNILNVIDDIRKTYGNR